MSGKTFKVILIGNMSVGKSTIINRFINIGYSSEYKPTIGIDIFQKEIYIDGKMINLTIWDTAGSEKYQSVVKSYYRGTDLLFLVFDVTNEQSFKDVMKWYEEYKSNDPRYEECIVNVIGNKIDMKNERVITEEQANQFSREHHWNYFETSASENIGIEECFQQVNQLGNLLKSSNYPAPPPIDEVKLNTNFSKKSSCCLYDYF